MLNAAEAAIDASAEDDAERARNRAKLYAPPAGAGVPRGARRAGTGARRPSRPSAAAAPAEAGGGMTRGRAQALMAQLAAEDGRLSGGR
jgi:hypothetical protein